jgi:signal transduction histidine kinase
MASRASPVNSAAFRFALAFAAIFAAAAFLLLGAVKGQIGRYAHEVTVGSLMTESAVLAAGPRGNLVAEIQRRVGATPDGSFLYLLTDASGHRLIGTVPSAAAHPGWGSVRMQEHAPTPSDPEYPEKLVTLGTRLGDGSLLVVATDGYDISRLGDHLVSFTLTWAIVITLLALIGGWIAGRAFLSRLAAVNAAVERIMAGRLDQRLPAIGLAPELNELSRNLNRMLDRIDGLMQGLRQVTTDVAHDLRTPLTRLRTMLEAARDADESGEKNAEIDAGIAQADHLLTVFRAILRLAQIEGGERRARFESVDLGKLLATLVETYEPVASDAKHTLVAPQDLHPSIKGDAELLAQLFANLIENAIIHTPPGTRVAIELQQTADLITVAVVDDGPGVPQAEHVNLARRFYQVDPSRGSGSAGLGLSIASAITTLHDARLTIGDEAPGLRVAVIFPRSVA